MIIPQPFDYVTALEAINKDIENTRNRAMAAAQLLNNIHSLFKDTDEYTIGDMSIYYNQLEVNIHLTEKGIFNSIEHIIESLSNYLGIDPSITDSEYLKGKRISFYSLSTSKKPTIVLNLYGNSKCKLVLVETKPSVLNTYRVECGEMQTIKELTYVPSNDPKRITNG